MKKTLIILLIFSIFLEANSLTKIYNSKYQLVNKYKQELASIESEYRCNIQTKTPSKFKYFEGILRNKNDGKLSNALNNLAFSNAEVNEDNFS